MCTFEFLALLTSKCASRHNGVPFSTFERPKVVRTPQFFTLLTWKSASHHNSLHFFDISTSKSGPGIVHFDLEMCFSHQAYFSTLQSHKSLEKHSEPRLSYLFAHLHLLSALVFSLLFFSSLTLPTSAFPTVHIVGSFTSKLPSTMRLYYYDSSQHCPMLHLLPPRTRRWDPLRAPSPGHFSHSEKCFLGTYVYYVYKYIYIRYRSVHVILYNPM